MAPSSLRTCLLILTAATAVRGVINVDPTTIDDVVRRSEVSLLEFHAPWCLQCQEFAPTWESIARRLRGIATIAAINGDKYPEVLAKYNIEAFPAIVVFVDGVVKEEYKAGMSEEAVLAFVEGIEAALEGLARGEVHLMSTQLYNRLYLRNESIVWLLLPPPLDSPSVGGWLDVYRRVAKTFAGRAAFTYIDLKSEGVVRLVGYPPTTAEAAVGITQAARHWARTDSPPLADPSDLAAVAPPFIEAVLRGARPPTVVSEPAPPMDIPRSDAVWEAVATTFDRIVLAPVDSAVAAGLPSAEDRAAAAAASKVLVMFFSRECPVSVSALEWLHLIAAQWADVAPSLRLVRFEAIDNDYDHERFMLKEYPTFFLLTREDDAAADAAVEEMVGGATFTPRIRELVDRVHYDEVVEFLKTEGVVPVGFEPREESDEASA